MITLLLSTVIWKLLYHEFSHHVRVCFFDGDSGKLDKNPCASNWSRSFDAPVLSFRRGLRELETTFGWLRVGAVIFLGLKKAISNAIWLTGFPQLSNVLERGAVKMCRQKFGFREFDDHGSEYFVAVAKILFSFLLLALTSLVRLLVI